MIVPRNPIACMIMNFVAIVITFLTFFFYLISFNEALASFTFPSLISFSEISISRYISFCLPADNLNGIRFSLILGKY